MRSLVRRTSAIKQAILDRITTHGAYVRLFESEDGKIVLRHILKTGFVTRSTFVAGDPHQTALNEGSRRLALSILKFAKKDHRELIEQIEEGVTDET